MNARLQPDMMKFLPCRGGCDFVTPILQQPPGRLRLAQNIEIAVNGGYQTARGYERYDGRPSPSDADYVYLACAITGTVSVGNTVTGSNSSATGHVIAVESAAVVVTKVTGTFEDAEDLEVSAVAQATTNDDPATNGASTPAKDREYLNLAADQYRADIDAVPGSGRVFGVCRYNSVLYAWRNNSGGTAAVIHKSTSSGWSAVSLGFELSFTSGGTYEIAEGNTITGATSGATAAITRVVLTSGTWAGGDAAGKVVFASQTGTFQSENLNVGANTNVATIAGDSSAITLQPSGRVKTVQFNFGGAAGTRRVYGCDGVNRGFEFDGTVYVPIDTGMTTDTPSNVVAFKYHLFFSFDSSVQFSSTGDPYNWTPVLGADEYGVGDTVTGFSVERGSQTDGALAVFSRNTIHMIYGNDSSDFVMVPQKVEVGALENSVQSLSFTVMVDDRGIQSLRAAQEFGNFRDALLSDLVNPWLQARKLTITDSCIARDKNQYRVFFSDDTALYITIQAGKVLGMMPQLLEHKVECITSVEGSTSEEIFFGSDGGYCYQMEKGTSFDGDNISWFGLMEFWHCEYPRIKKRFKSLSAEVVGESYAEFGIGYELGYGASQHFQPNYMNNDMSANFGDSRWDSFTWDDFWWDADAVLPQRKRMVGSAENVAVIFAGDSDEFEPLKFSGFMLRFQTGRLIR